MSGSERKRKRAIIAVAAAASAIFAAMVFVPSVLAEDSSAGSDPEAASASVDYDTASVTRRTLEETSKVNGTAGFGAARPLSTTADGIVTSAPQPGDVLQPGDTAVVVAGLPVVAVDGDTPMYRELRRVPKSERDAAGDKVGLQEGADVAQLQRFLVGLGYDNDGSLEADGVFGAGTEKAVKAWQRSVGHPATGRVDSSQIVFIDGAVRVETAPSVGERSQDLTVTGVTPVVVANVTNKQRGYFPIGAPIEMELATGIAVGAVSDLERSVSSDGSAAYRVEITPAAGADLAGLEAGDSVGLTARRSVAENVLTVPVRALVALAEGGWAVEVDEVGGPTLKAVELGEVIDGFAEITGLSEGDVVVVVAS